jgi:hypothetical protein
MKNFPQPNRIGSGWTFQPAKRNQRGENNMARETHDDDFEHAILSEEARLGLWATEGGYVPPLSDEAANEPESAG